MSRGREVRRAEHGFTLLELLVAVTLLGLLMAVLSGGLRLGARVWEAADGRLDAIAKMQIVQDFIRQRLAETLPLERVPPDPADPGISEPLFLGTAEAVRFASLFPEHLGAGLYLAELHLTESRDAGVARNLVLRWHPLEASDPTAEEVEERMLIENIEGLELSYFGTIDPGQPPSWQQSWKQQPGLPGLIRLRVRFADDDERRWPELVVRPMLDATPVSGS